MFEQSHQSPKYINRINTTIMNQFTLILKSTGSKFLSVAKVIAKHTNKELDEVMESLEELPFTVVNDAGEAEAKALAEQLEALGAEVETQKQESMPSGATLVLTDIGPKTIKVAKLVAITTNKELDQVLEALEELPYSIGNLSEEDAAELKEELEVLGAEVQLQKLASPATNVTLVLNAVGPKPLKVAKLIANATKMERDQVLEAIEELPYSIKDLDKEEALKLKEELETLGASVNLTGIPTASPTSCESVKPSGLKDAPAPAPAKNNPKPEDASTSTFDAPVSPEPPESNVQSDSVLTSKFEKDWRKIEKEAELIKKENLLPFSFTDIDGTTAERSVEDFDKQLDSLKTEKFTISVCGMVKAGKSTFLNALLFGEDILPAFDTPMTAKLNFIEYTDENNHFIVNYYDQEEWNALLENLDEENLQQLNERIQLCAEDYGIDQDDYIGAPPHKEKDLRKLEEFVSDPKSKKGKYTPFVKDVHIFIHNESIKDVRIVDTPGLNDPNVINSRETTKWIKNTHALIFLLPNKGLDESSLKFFDTHLLGTRPTNRVWVINKIDDISDDDLQKTKAYIRQLGTQEEFKAKNLFGRDEKICGYSALIAMLRNMEKQGMDLNEDQVYHLENVGEDFNPDPDQLGNIIGERLYQNTGVKRIIAGVTAINTLY